MKRRKFGKTKVIAYLLVLIMLLTSIQPAFTASAATKKATSLKLSGSLTAMHVGQSCKMSYKMKPSKKAESVSWKSSNKKILTIDKSGKLKAKKEGTSKITATTPSGKKASTSVLVVNKLGETSKQKRINQILKSSKTKKLYINNTKKASKYKIKKGNYSKKSLTINTSSSTIANYGTFKSIRIKGMGNKRFTEYAKGNKITASGKKFSLYVKKQGNLKSLTLSDKNGSAKLRNDGTIETVSILSSKISVKLSGSGIIQSVMFGSKVSESSSSSSIEIENGSTIDTLTINFPNVTVKGPGSVKNIVVNANNANISTGNTRIVVPTGIIGTTIANKVVSGGKTYVTNADGTEFTEEVAPVVPSPTTGGQVIVTPKPTPIPQIGDPNTYTITYETNGGKSITPSVINNSNYLRDVPMAEKGDSIFTGWYTDSSLQTPFYSQSHTNGDITVYAKYAELEKKQTKEVDSYTLSNVGTDQSFVVSAKGMNETQIRNSITVTSTGIGDNSEIKITSIGDDKYKIDTKDGFSEGAAVTISLSEGINFVEKDSNGNDIGEEIRNVSFTVFQEEVNSLEFNDDMIEIKLSDVSDLVEPIAAVDDPSTNGVDESIGSFTYKGSSVIQENIIIALYDTVKPSKSGTSIDFKNDIIYAMVITADKDNNQSNGYQVVFCLPPASEILTTPNTLPIDLSDVISNTNNSVTMASSVYDGYWVDYDHIGLSAETTAQIGDALVLMGEEKDDTGEPIVTYGRITNVYNQATNKIILYETTTYDKIIGDSQDYYAKQDLDYDDIVQEAIDAGIPEQLESQAIDSGFAESAMQYLAETAMQTQSITDMMQTSAFGANVDITLPSFPDDWEPNIIIPPVLLDGWSVKAKISTDTDHFGDGGLMCQLYLNGKIEIPLSTDPFPDTIQIELTATFEQEMKIIINAKGGIVWEKLAFIPYPSDVYMNTNVDVFDYTAIKIHAVVRTVEGGIDLGGLKGIDELDISSEIQKLLGLEDSEEQMAGTEKLFDMYASLLDNETDYVTLITETILDLRFTILGVFKVGIKTDVAIKANINVVLGSSFEYSNGNRYNFWFKLRSGESGNSVMPIADEQMKFQFYVMGMIGIRAGLDIEIGVFIELPKDFSGNTFEAAATGILVETGGYVELYGYFVYTLESLNKLSTSDMSGALFVDAGIFLDISYFARVIAGALKYERPIYSDKFSLLTAGERINIYDFAYEQEEEPEPYIIKNFTSDYLPSSFWNMRGMDLMRGDIIDINCSKDKFVYTFSNKAFSFDQSSGKITVDVSDNTRYMECMMTMTWAGNKLAFSTGEINRKIPIVWTNLADEELSLRHTVSVVLDNEVIWSTVVREGQEYELPDKEKLKELTDYGKFNYTYGNKTYDLKYSGGSLNYINQNGGSNILIADRDLTYTVDLTKRVYSINIQGVENLDGSKNNVNLSATFGEYFDLSSILASGTSIDGVDVESTVYTKYSTTWVQPKGGSGVVEGNEVDGKSIDSVIDISFAKQLIAQSYDYIAKYVDDSVMLTYQFVDSRGKQVLPDIEEKIRKDSYPTFDYHNYVKSGSKKYMVKRFNKTLDKATKDTVYTATSVLALGQEYAITLKDLGQEDNVLMAYQGEYVALPQLKKTGYTFSGYSSTSSTALTELVMGNANMNLTAAWSANQVAIDFDVNAFGVSVGASPSGTKVTFGKVYTGIPDADSLRRNNYKLVGWSRVQHKPYQFDETVPEGTLVDKVEVDSAHTLYAVWQMKKSIADDYFDKTPKASVVYDKMQHPFTLIKNTNATENIPADSFLVQYKPKIYPPNRWVSQQKEDIQGNVIASGPSDADEWDVLLYRPEDDEYQMYKQVIRDGVVINKAVRKDVTFTLPTQITNMTYNSVTVNPGSVTGADVGAGILMYYAQNIYGKGKPTDSLSVVFGYDSMYYGKIYMGLKEDRNYHELWENDKYYDINYESIEVPTIMSFNPIFVSLDIKTSTVSYGGTDSDVYFRLITLNGGTSSSHLDKSGYNDFERGDQKTYEYNVYTNPWIFNGEVEVSLDGGDAWTPEFVKYNISQPGFETLQGTLYPGKLEKSSYRYRIANIDYFKRLVTSYGQFDQWGGKYVLDSSSKGVIKYDYDGMITDQYGTYHVFNAGDAPVITVGYIDQRGDFTDSPYKEFIDYSNYEFKIDKAKVYNKMIEREESSVTIIIRMKLNNTFVGAQYIDKLVTFSR